MNTCTEGKNIFLRNISHNETKEGAVDLSLLVDPPIRLVP